MATCLGQDVCYQIASIDPYHTFRSGLVRSPMVPIANNDRGLRDKCAHIKVASTDYVAN